jgi:hypothetical protein
MTSLHLIFAYLTLPCVGVIVHWMHEIINDHH